MYASMKRPVKATRIAPRPAARFGEGLIDHDAEDAEWDLDTALEQRAIEFEMADRLERGLIHDGREPAGVEELVELDREPRLGLPIDWDRLGRLVDVRELDEAGYRW